MEKFIAACRTGDVDVVRLLLRNEQVDPSIDDNLAVKYASINGHLEVVRLLLSNKQIDPSTQNNFVIRQASKEGCINIVRLLLNDSRVLYGDQQTLKNKNIQKILEENRNKKAAIIWWGKAFSGVWRYLCPVIAVNMKY